MIEDQAAHITAIYRYPVKGLSPEALTNVTLTPGETLPYDRAWAIENGPGRFDPEAPHHLPKINFLMLMRNERLAALETHLDAETHTLTILRGGKQIVRGALDMRLGRQMLEQFFAAYIPASELRGPPHIVWAQGHSFSDVADKCIHIVNLASVRDVARVTGREVDPLRFRANIYVEGIAPWAERKWLDGEIRIGDARLEVFKHTKRCDATNVDPATGARDMGIPATLVRSWGHSDLGIYARVTRGGAIAPGTALIGPEA